MKINSVDQTRKNTKVDFVANKNEHAESAKLMKIDLLLLDLQLFNQNNNNNEIIIIRSNVAEVIYLYKNKGDRDRKRAASEALQHEIEKG